MKRIFLALSAAIVTAACAAPIVKVEQFPLSAAEAKVVERATRDKLKDPYSANFRNIRKVHLTDASGSRVIRTCGEVNAKNSFGAYIGYKTFVGTFSNGKFTLSGIGTSDTDAYYRALCGA